VARANQSPESGPTSAEPADIGGPREGAEPAGGTGPANGPQAIADLEFVKGLIEAVDASGIDSLEITRAGTRVKIAKTPPAAAGSAYYAVPAGFPHGGPAPGGLNAASPASPPSAGSPATNPPAGSPEAPAGVGPTGSTPEAPAAGPGSGLVEVKSPMVGTFYRAPAPEAPPYVEVGSRVVKGQTLCILEAMKLMNELESEVEGVVRQVLVENAEPVEYGQVLFRIDPAG
jgi:acetyl-CoA carboxylase biotin carboxyl carrier protein